MTMTPNPLIPGENVPPPKSSWRPILITIFSALLLGAGSCFGFVSTFNMNRQSTMSAAFAVLFLLCVIFFVGGVVWAIVSFIRFILTSGRGE